MRSFAVMAAEVGWGACLRGRLFQSGAADGAGAVEAPPAPPDVQATATAADVIRPRAAIRAVMYGVATWAPRGITEGTVRARGASRDCSLFVRCSFWNRSRRFRAV